MKKSNIFFRTKNQYPVLMVLILFCVTVTLLSSCKKEDDIPPTSAYIPPEPDTTGACVFLNIMPVVNVDDAVSFECEGPGEFTFFGELDGMLTIEYAENPAVDGINMSDKVVQVTQTAGVESWAGFFFDLSAKIDFSVMQSIRIKVYSNAVGQNVNLKLEDSTDGSLSTETSTQTTVANEWEELCFSFASADSDMFDRFVLFFDFLGPKDAETIHYFDDIIIGEECMDGGGPLAVPTMAAPTPAVNEDNVISLFSNVYTDVTVDTWRTDWSQATLLDTMIASDDVKKYSDLTFVGIETVMNQLDVTSMTHFHTDIWTANATEVKIKIVDFGPDGAFDGGDDTEHEITIENPALEEWVSLDIPLADLVGLTTRANVAQFIYSASLPGEATLFMDNVFFYDIDGLVLAPAFPAPMPTIAESNVISMFSDVYTDVIVDTWRTDWSQADFEEVDIMGDAVLKYSNLNFVGAETVMNQIDVTSMSHFHFDVWTADATTFRVKLVDFGPDGAFDGGDDTEHEIVVENPMQEEWLSLDIALTDFVGLTTQEHISQLIFSGLPSGGMTLFIDNIYFHNNMAPLTEPAMAAPTPTHDAANVISMFSDAYTNVAVDTWQTGWSQADFEEVDIMGSATLKYSNLNFVGAETVANQIDVSSMTHFHFDVWTPDAETYRVKLVDFGPDGGFDGGDDTEHEIVYDGPTQGEWISYDVALTDFVGLTTNEHIAQLIFSGLPSGELTLFIDNIYFHN